MGADSMESEVILNHPYFQSLISNLTCILDEKLKKRFSIESDPIGFPLVCDPIGLRETSPYPIRFFDY